jgi:hypothetical protein
MKAEVEAFHREFIQEVQRAADADERFAEDAFFELFCDHLIAAGELETADRAHFVAARGMRIDGYGGDPLEAEGTLSLIVADFHQQSEVETLTATDMEAAFKRGRTFLAKALDKSFRTAMEETSPGFALADLVASTWSGVSKVKLILITNRLLSSRIDSMPSGEQGSTPIVHSVWDIGRLHRYVTSGRSKEDIVVDLAEYGRSLPVLPAHFENAPYQSFLTVIPGSQLASIYSRWGSRLLEQNVRVFLQAKGGVNKGIRNTIENNSEMFFAYNNGLTATAEEVKTERTSGGLVITQIRNLQIVNGGQTTASIYAAHRKSADLTRVFVQMKLSVIAPERSEEVVPKISEYANSQNKVNAADFFANHPFHLRMKEFSERTLAPSRDGTLRESKWFYERARGQYQDARSNLTASQKGRFDLEYPKAQLFDKTDLAKFVTVWQEQPEVVSKGAQKNFAAFAERIGKEWESNPDTFNEAWFRTSIAKAIVFNDTETLVTKQPWYEGGYRAQVVAYAIAKIARDVRVMGRAVDFESIWKAQTLPSPMRQAITVAAKAAHDVLTTPPEGRYKNVTEWAKQSACWTRVAALEVGWPQSFLDSLLEHSEQKARNKDAIKSQQLLNGIQAQMAVVEAGGDCWVKIRDWGVAKKLLSQKEIDILSVAAKIPAKIPSESQSYHVLQTLHKLKGEGCTLGDHVKLT